MGKRRFSQSAKSIEGCWRERKRKRGMSPPSLQGEKKKMKAQLPPRQCPRRWKRKRRKKEFGNGTVCGPGERETLYYDLPLRKRVKKRISGPFEEES